MTDDLAIYTVLWRSTGSSYMLDFDRRETACYHAETLKKRGEADVFVSGPQTADVALSRIEDTSRRTLAAVVERLQAENTRWQIAAGEAIAVADERKRELEQLNALQHIVPVEAA